MNRTICQGKPPLRPRTVKATLSPAMHQEEHVDNIEGYDPEPCDQQPHGPEVYVEQVDDKGQEERKAGGYLVCGGMPGS